MPYTDVTFCHHARTTYNAVHMSAAMYAMWAVTAGIPTGIMPTVLLQKQIKNGQSIDIVLAKLVGDARLCIRFQQLICHLHAPASCAQATVQACARAGNTLGKSIVGAGESLG